MSLISIFLGMFFILGMFLGPLVLAGATAAFSSSRSRRLGDWSFATGLKSVWRPALTFNAADELTLKKRSYDESHDEQKIAFGGLFSSVERFLFDPQNRAHDFFGTPFAFVDERFGIVHDPRDAALGRMLLDEQDAGRYTRRVVRGQRMIESVLGVFEVPKGHIGARLPDIWALVGGCFDAQGVRTIHEFYRKGQEPKESTTALRQLALPVGTFIAIVLLGMFAAGQGAGGGGGGSGPSAPVNESTIGIGSSMLMLLALPAAYRLRDTLVAAFFVGVTALVAVGLYFAFPVWVPVLGIPLPLGVWGVVFLLLGGIVLPITASWNRGLAVIGPLLGLLFITIGLLAYDRPVITLVDGNRYEVVEYADADWPVEPQWYRFALTRVGVGFLNSEDLWRDDIVHSPAGVREMARAVTDGGVELEKPDVSPPGYRTTPLLQQDDIYGYVPVDVDEDALYVRTDLTTGWFEEAGQNRRLMRAALEHAKEKYGGGNKPVGDKWILMASLAAMVMGAVFDWLVFFS